MSFVLDCPCCGAEIRHGENAWAVWHQNAPFRCPHCATMVKRTWPWWSRVIGAMLGAAFPLSMALWSHFDGTVYDGNPSAVQARQRVVLTVIVLAFGVFFWVIRSLHMCTQRLVIHSDE